MGLGNNAFDNANLATETTSLVTWRKSQKINGDLTVTGTINGENSVVLDNNEFLKSETQQETVQ